jgi:hypothetical protein
MKEVSGMTVETLMVLVHAVTEPLLERLIPLAAATSWGTVPYP